jgi:urea carboxylase
VVRTLLIANRGEIACRVAATARRLGVRTVAVYSDADAGAAHVAACDQAIRIGGSPAADSYLRIDRIVAAARAAQAEAIHPGYGFLSENAEFAADCENAGIRFIGPTSEQIKSFGLKHVARELAAKAGAPLLPGTTLLTDAEEASKAAEQIGFPVMVKSTAGGGGIGLQLCRSAAELQERFATVKRLGEANFKQGGVYLEKFVEMARHVEVQIFGDGEGQVRAVG